MGQGPVAFSALVGGDFELRRPLKAGGFGTVYEAFQRSTGRLRAVKVLHQRIADDPSSVERFRLEATAASKFSSDYVVQVVSAGIDPHGGAWIAMELLKGCDLADWVQSRGPMSWPEARRVLQQICHALGSAHRAGIVHRDLKPENVFMAESSGLEGGFVTKVLDFGIAKALEGTSTTTGGIGSWTWLAPEQATTRSRVTPSTDVWALGLVAFFLVTGRLYWLSSQEGSDGSLIQELGQRTFEAPSRRAFQLGCGERIPPGFDAWFARCVAHSGRFANADEAYWALPAVAPSDFGGLTQRAHALSTPSPHPRPRLGAWLVGGGGALGAVASVALLVKACQAPPVVEPDAGASGSTSVTGSEPATHSSGGPSEQEATPTPALTPAFPDAPGCAADCRGGCRHLLLSTGPSFSTYETIALQLRSEEHLCAEVYRLPRRAQLSSDQFVLSLWVPQSWRPPSTWATDDNGNPTVPGTSLPVAPNLLRVPSVNGRQLLPPACVPGSLSFRSQSETSSEPRALHSCTARPELESTIHDGVWTWLGKAGGDCSCQADDSELTRMRELGSCLRDCRLDARCVEQCEDASASASSP